MDSVDMEEYVVTSPEDMQFEEHNLEEQFLNIDNYHEDIPMAYRIHASIPNTFVFRVPNDVVPPCVSCSVPVSIKKNLPPDYEMLDAINVRITLEIVPSSPELDTLGAKAFWSTHAKDAMKKEIDCIVYKEGAVRPCESLGDVGSTCRNDVSGSGNNDDGVAGTPTALDKKPSRSVSFASTLSETAEFAVDSPSDYAVALRELNGFNLNVDDLSIQQTFPLVSASPKLMYFLEGDEPLLDNITIFNSGSTSVVYRVVVSTPNRFLISSLGGRLQARASMQIAIELRSFPAQLLEGPSSSFATFYIDFANSSNSFSENDVDGFFNSLGDIYIRKVVESRAVPWDERFAIESRLKFEPAEDAPTQHDGFTTESCDNFAPGNLNEELVEGIDPSDHESVLSSVPNTPRGGESVDSGRFPRASVSPKCLLFLEGDEPLLDSISIRNSGARAVLFRINVSTPNRFVITTAYGELEADAQTVIPIELKSFPSHLPDGDFPLAQFSVDFVLRDTSYIAGDIDSFFNAAGDIYLRKMVLCSAIGYDQRDSADQMRSKQLATEAPVEYNGYLLAVSVGRLNHSQDLLSPRKAFLPKLQTIFSSSESCDSVGYSPGHRPSPLNISKSKSNFSSFDNIKDENAAIMSEVGEVFGSVDMKSEIVLGSNAQVEKFDTPTRDRPTILVSRRHPSVKHLDIILDQDDLPELAVPITAQPLADPASIAKVKHDKKSISNPSAVIGAEARPAPISRRHSVDAPELPSADEKRRKSVLGMASVLSEFSKRSTSGDLKLRRRASLATTKVSADKSPEIKRSEMTSVLSEFSKKLQSGQLKLRRSAIVSQAEKKRRQRVEEASGDFKGVLGELRFLFSFSGAAQEPIKEEDLRSYNTRGESVHEDELKGSYVVMSSFDINDCDDKLSPATGSADGTENEYTVIGESKDDSLDLFPPSPFSSPILTSKSTLTGGILQRSGIFSPPAEYLDSKLVPMLREEQDDILAAKDQLIAQKNARIEELNEQIDELISLQQSSSDELGANKKLEMLKLQGEFELKILSLRLEYDSKVEAIHQEAELLKERHKLDLLSLSNQNSAQAKELLREKDAEILSLSHRIEEYAAMLDMTDEEKVREKDLHARRLSNQFEDEIKKLRRMVDDIKFERDFAISSLNEQHQVEMCKVVAQQETEMFKLRQKYDVDMSKLTLQLEELRRAKDSELNAAKIEKEAKVKSLTNSYELDLMALRQMIEDTKLVQITSSESDNQALDDATRRNQQQDAEVAVLKARIEILKNEKEFELRTLTQQYEEEIADMKQQNENEFSCYRLKQEVKISSLNKQLQQQKIEWQEEVEALSQQKESDLAFVQKQHDVKFHSVVQQYELKLCTISQQQESNHVHEVIQQQEDMMAALASSKKAEINALVMQHDVRVHSMMQQHDAKIENLNRDMEALAVLKEMELKELSQQKDAKIRSLMKQQAVTVGSLTQQLEELSLRAEQQDTERLSASSSSSGAGPLVSHLQEMLSQQEARINELNEINRELENKYSYISQQRDNDMRSKTKQHEEIAKSLSHQLSELNKDREIYIASLKEQHESELRTVTQKFENKINLMNLHRETRLEALKKRHEEDISDLKQAHEESLQGIRQQKEDEVRMALRQFESKQRTLYKQIEQLTQQREHDSADAKSQLENELAELTRRHEIDMASRSKQNSVRVAAIVQQSDIKVLALRQELENAYLAKEAELTNACNQKEAMLRMANQELEAEIVKRNCETDELNRRQAVFDASQQQQKGSEFRLVQKKHEAEITSLTQEHLAAVHRLEADMMVHKDTSESRLRMLTKKHEADILKLQHSQQSAVLALSDKLSDEISAHNDLVESLQTQRNAEIAALVKQHESTIASMREGFNSELQKSQKRMEDESLSIKNAAERAVKVQYEFELTRKDKEIDRITQLAALQVENLKKQTQLEKDGLTDKYENQLDALNKQLESLALKLSLKETGTFMTQVNDRFDTVEATSRAVDQITVAPNSLSFTLGHSVSEDFVVLSNKGSSRVAYRTRVSVQNMFVVKNGDGVLDGGGSCHISITSKPSVVFESLCDIPVVKFAVELLEVDHLYSEIVSRNYWRENSTFSIRKSIPAEITLAAAPLESKNQSTMMQTNELNAVLKILKSKLVTGALSDSVSAESKYGMTRLGDIEVNTRRAVRADHSATLRPRGRVLDLLVISLGNEDSLSPSEFEELKTTRNNMSADRWAEWVSFAKTEKAKRAATDRDKLISQMHQKEYKEGLIGFSGPSSRDASPSRWSSSKLKPSANVTLLSGVSALDSLQRQPVRPLFNGTSGVPSNQLQWSETHNSVSPTLVMPTRAAPFPNARTPESPLMMAKALVSTINSEYADINDIKSKLMVLEGVMDVLDNKSQLRSQRSEQLGRYFDEVKSESSGTSRYSNTNSEIRCESPSANNVKRM